MKSDALCPMCGGGVWPGREIATCRDPFHEHAAQEAYLEQARLVGMGSEREALLQGEIGRLEKRVARAEAAVEIARKKGEHYPVCSYSRIKETPCDCWKNEMEVTFKGKQ